MPNNYAIKKSASIKSQRRKQPASDAYPVDAKVATKFAKAPATADDSSGKVPDEAKAEASNPKSKKED